MEKKMSSKKKIKDHDCTTFKTVKLKNYQLLPAKFIVNPLNRGLLLLFDVGHGKTLSSIAMIRCLLAKYPQKHVIVLTPASLITNYQNELKKVSGDLGDPILDRIRVESYGKYINYIKNHHLKANNNTILVCDEAQYLIGAGSSRFKNIFDFSVDAYKVILLSATPVRNGPEEISNLMSLLNGAKFSRSLIEKVFQMVDPKDRTAGFKKLLNCKIAYHRPSANSRNPDGTTASHNKDFPQRIDHRVPLVMSKDYYQNYLRIQENVQKDLPDAFQNTTNLTTFLNGIRRAVNVSSITLISPKIDWTINKIKKDLGMIPGFKGNKKVLVYSNWLDAGVNLLKAELTILGIPFSEVTGQLSRAQKDIEIKNYNSGKNKVILISASGAEGLNLKNTRSVILLEQAWNNSRLEQAIGRAIRLHSHRTLPEAQRKVDVYSLILEKPKSVKANGDIVPSGDQILELLSRNKDYSINKFYEILSSVSIEKNKSCF